MKYEKVFLRAWYCDVANPTWFSSRDFAMESCTQITNP